MNSCYGWIPVTMFKCPVCGGLEQDMDDAVCSHKCGKNPLFTSKVDARGRLTIRSDVRQRKGIKPGDSVDVFEIEKVVSDESNK